MFETVTSFCLHLSTCKDKLKKVTDNANRGLNINRIGTIERYTRDHMSTIKSCFAPPNRQQGVQDTRLVKESIAYIENANPESCQILLQLILSNKRSLQLFMELMAQPIPNPQNQPDSGCFNYACCLHAHLYMGQVKIPFEPKFEGALPSGNFNIGLDFNLSFDRTDRGKKME